MMENVPKIQNVEYEKLFESIGILLSEARSQIATNVNTTMVQTYWTVGKYIVEYQQNGKERAEYGEEF